MKYIVCVPKGQVDKFLVEAESPDEARKKVAEGEGEFYMSHSIDVDVETAKFVVEEYVEPTEDEPRPFGKHMDYWEKVGKEINAKTVWSHYEAEDADAVAFEGTFALHYDEHWGDVGPLKSLLPDNPTWKDLYTAADLLIRASGDKRHIFIEEFVKKENDLHLITGS